MSTGRQLLIGVVCGLLITSAVPLAAAGDDVPDSDEPMVHIGVSEDGDVILSVVSMYDLTDDADRAAFDSLDDDADARAQIGDRFENRLAGVADDLPDSSGDDLAEPTVVVESDGDRGTVIVSVTWTDLAASDDGTLELHEPFASGFETDRTLVVSAPTDGTIADAAPNPDSLSDTRASWDGDSDLTGFEVMIDTADTDADGLPGFGITTAVGGLIGALALAGRLHSARA